jgi:hypothetical protein
MKKALLKLGLLTLGVVMMTMYPAKAYAEDCYAEPLENGETKYWCHPGETIQLNGDETKIDVFVFEE